MQSPRRKFYRKDKGKMFKVCLLILSIIVPVTVTVLNWSIYGVRHMKFSYPITATFIQWVGAFILLSIINGFFGPRNQSGIDLHGNIVDSKFFSRGFWKKFQLYFFPSLVYGLEIIGMNVGLFYMSISYSKILRSIKIFFTMLLSRIFLKKQIHKYQIIAVILSWLSFLSIFLSFVTGDIYHNFRDAPKAFIMNSIASFLGAVFLVSLAKANTKANQELPIKMTSLQTSELMMFWMSLVMLPLSLVFEPTAILELFDVDKKVLILLGFATVFTLINKVIVFTIVKHFTPVTVMFITQLRVIPEIIIDSIFFHKYDFQIYFVFSILFMLLSSVLYRYGSVMMTPRRETIPLLLETKDATDLF
ncbi:hypothetical protein PCE1_000713 [Barthelona sp. PCE]